MIVKENLSGKSWKRSVPDASNEREMRSKMKKFSFKSSILLFLAAFIWGIAFVAQSVGMDYMGPLTFNGIRFLMGSMVLFPFILYRRNKNKKAGVTPYDTRATLVGGVCCGLALCAAALLQQYGILYTTVGKAGFITTLYIILVPFFGIFLKKKIPGKIWIGAGIAAIGMYLLCVSEKFALGKGDAYVFVCAILFAIHILVVDFFSPKADGVELSCIQFFTAGVIATILAFVFEQPTLSGMINGIIPLAYAGILSSGVAYTFQVLGQKNMDPTIASLILSMESVVSVLAGFIILKQELTIRELFGCVLV